MTARRSFARRAALALAVAAAAPGALGARVCAAAPSGAARGVGLSLGALAGSTQPAAGLADFQWDTRPQLGLGARALLRFGRFDSGLRLWRTETTQRIDLGGGAEPPAVRSTSVEVVGRGRLAERAAIRMLATASVGRLHLGYHPDRVVIPSTGAEIGLAPVDTWVAGAGVAVERSVGGAWNLGVEVDHRVFGLDTARSEGGAVVNRHESFGEWSARLEVARRYGRQ